MTTLNEALVYYKTQYAMYHNTPTVSLETGWGENVKSKLIELIRAINTAISKLKEMLMKLVSKAGATLDNLASVKVLNRYAGQVAQYMNIFPIKIRREVEEKPLSPKATPFVYRMLGPVFTQMGVNKDGVNNAAQRLMDYDRTLEKYAMHLGLASKAIHDKTFDFYTKFNADFKRNGSAMRVDEKALEELGVCTLFDDWFEENQDAFNTQPKDGLLARLTPLLPPNNKIGSLTVKTEKKFGSAVIPFYNNKFYVETSEARVKDNLEILALDLKVIDQVVTYVKQVKTQLTGYIKRIEKTHKAEVNTVNKASNDIANLDLPKELETVIIEVSNFYLVNTQELLKATRAVIEARRNIALALFTYVRHSLNIYRSISKDTSSVESKATQAFPEQVEILKNYMENEDLAEEDEQNEALQKVLDVAEKAEKNEIPLKKDEDEESSLESGVNVYHLKKPVDKLNLHGDILARLHALANSNYNPHHFYDENTMLKAFGNGGIVDTSTVLATIDATEVVCTSMATVGATVNELLDEICYFMDCHEKLINRSGFNGLQNAYKVELEPLLNKRLINGNLPGFDDQGRCFYYSRSVVFGKRVSIDFEGYDVSCPTTEVPRVFMGGKRGGDQGVVQQPTADTCEVLAARLKEFLFMNAFLALSAEQYDNTLKKLVKLDRLSGRSSCLRERFNMLYSGRTELLNLRNLLITQLSVCTAQYIC